MIVKWNIEMIELDENARGTVQTTQPGRDDVLASSRRPSVMCAVGAALLTQHALRYAGPPSSRRWCIVSRRYSVSLFRYTARSRLSGA